METETKARACEIHTYVALDGKEAHWLPKKKKKKKLLYLVKCILIYDISQLYISMNMELKALNICHVERNF